jgi:hypothetical protein
MDLERMGQNWLNLLHNYMVKREYIDENDNNHSEDNIDNEDNIDINNQLL